MPPNNPICELLEIKYPIIQGGIPGISDFSLASEVSNLGGLGVIGVGLREPDWLKEQIHKTKERTKNQFGVNIFVKHPKIDKLVQILIQEGVKIVFTSGGNPLFLLPFFQAAGIRVIPIVPTPRLAKKMEDNNADAVCILGYESSWQIGYGTTISLLPPTKKLVKKIPIIAGGGIFDRVTAKSVFLLGADGIWMETRFLASSESPISNEYKEKIINAGFDDLEIVFNFTPFPIRVIKNDWSKKMKALEEKGAFPEEINFKEVFDSIGENIQNSPLLAGLSTPSISEIKSCKEIFDDILHAL